MKNGFYFSIPVLCCILACAPFEPDEKVLLHYIRCQDVYREGKFSEAAKMLGGEKKFVPALVLRGKAEYLSGDLASAEKSLRQALSREGGNTDTLIFLARICRETGKSGEARQMAGKILANNPLDVRALRFMAELERERGAPGEAASVAFLDRAVEASAESALVFLDRARSRWIGGNSSGALEDLGRARALISKDSPVYRAVERLEAVINGVSNEIL